MIRAMYSAISGLKQQQTALDVTSNNLANVNTIGFKAARATFKDQLQQNISGGSASGATSGGQNARQVGLGVTIGSIDNLMNDGNVQTTGQPLDISISGEGFFRVASSTPPATPSAAQTQYTRAGNFTKNDQGYVTTSDGHYVLNYPTAGNPNTGQYIQIPTGASGVAVGADGTVSYAPAGGGNRVTAGIISLAKFPNEDGLVRQQGNLWSTDPASGAEIVGRPGGDYGPTVGGTLESSNVDLASEFTNMIVAQRAFQANSRVISTTDEMLQDLVNLKH